MFNKFLINNQIYLYTKRNINKIEKVLLYSFESFPEIMFILLSFSV